MTSDYLSLLVSGVSETLWLVGVGIAAGVAPGLSSRFFFGSGLAFRMSVTASSKLSG